jgi:hypothetical protein
MTRTTLFAMAAMFVVCRGVCAGPEELPFSAQSWDSNPPLPEKGVPYANEFPTPSDSGPPTLSSDLPPLPDLDQPPPPSPRWDIDLAYVPTTLFDDPDDLGQAYRLNIASEGPDGYGRRARFWFFQQDFRFSNELTATLFSYDFYRRVQFKRGELTFGWGPEASYSQAATPHHHFDRNFYGVGAGVFLEGFYPLLRYEKTQIGPVGSARLASLIGVVENDGSIEFGQGTIPVIEEFAWGVELRHRFGAHQNKYFYVDVERDLQEWGSWGVPYVSFTSFQGTAVHLGFGW